MIPDENPPPPDLPKLAAPARTVRLVAKPVVPLDLLAAAARPTATALPASEPLKTGSLERKLSGLTNAQDMLHVMNTELALQRAVRLHGGDGKSRQAMRVLSVTLLFALLIAALAAMAWMQNHLAQKGFSRHRTEVSSPK